MTERDAVDQFLELGMSELAPSVRDKERHRAALRRLLATSGGASSPVRGWSALRASGAAGWTAGTLLLSAGIGLGIWLQASFAQRWLLEPMPTASRAAVVEDAAGAGVPSSAAPVLPTSPAEPSDAPSSSSDRTLQGDGVTSPTQVVEAPQASIVTKPAPRATSPRRATIRRHPSERALNAVEPPEPIVTEPFDEELALLQRVERALRAQHSSVAVALLAELDDRFPQTRLAEERNAASLIAECQQQLPEAVSRAERFLTERGASVYAPRVRAACARQADDDFSTPEKARAPADTLRR